MFLQNQFKESGDSVRTVTIVLFSHIFLVNRCINVVAIVRNLCEKMVS